MKRSKGERMRVNANAYPKYQPENQNTQGGEKRGRINGGRKRGRCSLEFGTYHVFSTTEALTHTHTRFPPTKLIGGCSHISSIQHRTNRANNTHITLRTTTAHNNDIPSTILPLVHLNFEPNEHVRRVDLERRLGNDCTTDIHERMQQRAQRGRALLQRDDEGLTAEMFVREVEEGHDAINVMKQGRIS